jgi:hypothetical protein
MNTAHRIFYCTFATHDGHTGCSEFMWLYDIAEEILGGAAFLFLFSIIVWMLWVELRKETR